MTLLEKLILGYLVVVLAALLLTAHSLGIAEDKIELIEKQAIEYGYAETDRSTGKWQWKEVAK